MMTTKDQRVAMAEAERDEAERLYAEAQVKLTQSARYQGRAKLGVRPVAECLEALDACRERLANA